MWTYKAWYVDWQATDVAPLADLCDIKPSSHVWLHFCFAFYAMTNEENVLFIHIIYILLSLKNYELQSKLARWCLNYANVQLQKCQ